MHSTNALDVLGNFVAENVIFDVISDNPYKEYKFTAGFGNSAEETFIILRNCKFINYSTVSIHDSYFNINNCTFINGGAFTI